MEDLKTKFIFLIIIIFAVRLMMNHIYDPTLHRGPWYKVRIPDGWTKEVEEDEVFFKSPAKDYLGNPEAIFSIYGYQSRGALFMDLFFPDVISSLAKQNGKLLQHGQVKIDGVVSNWTLFRHHEPELIIWTFYSIDDHNRLTKTQMICKPDHFAAYRPVFDTFKDNIKFKSF